MNEIQVILFDWGNVLGRFNHWHFCERVATLLNCQTEEVYAFVFKTGLNRMLDEGRLSVANLHRSVLKRFSGEAKSLPFDVFEESWTDIVTGDNPEMETVLERIQPHIKVVVFSNTNETQWRRIAQLPLMRKYFSDEKRTVLSFRCGFAKPDVRLFQEAIKRCEYKLHHILYIDDIYDYVRVFESMGGNGFVYSCEIDPISTLERELNAHGILQEKE